MKALIAMSGGVDSSVAAKLMSEKGYECIGATMRLYDREDDVTEVSCSAPGEDGSLTSATGGPNGLGPGQTAACRTCCSETDAADARAVAGRLGMLCHTLNYKDDFKVKVIDKFISAYEQGITPNPCIDCNRYMKFDILLKKAEELGCDKLVTGHYARIDKDETGRFRLKKASDVTKDQSYVLYMLTQEQLSRIEFPLGEYAKTDTRDMASQAGFVNSDKPDSQDICFVPDGDYASVIERYARQRNVNAAPDKAGETAEGVPDKAADFGCPGMAEGDFVDKEGNVLGRHKGIIHYTLGQRKGLGISADRPLYVIALDKERNRVVLGDNEDLFAKVARFEDINWISGQAPADGAHLSAKTRYRQKEQPGTLKKISEDVYEFVFDESVRAITPGQALVVYDGDIVVGGGTII